MNRRSRATAGLLRVLAGVLAVAVSLPLAPAGSPVPSAAAQPTGSPIPFEVSCGAQMTFTAAEVASGFVLQPSSVCPTTASFKVDQRTIAHVQFTVLEMEASLQRGFDNPIDCGAGPLGDFRVDARLQHDGSSDWTDPAGSENAGRLGAGGSSAPVEIQPLPPITTITWNVQLGARLATGCAGPFDEFSNTLRFGWRASGQVTLTAQQPPTVTSLSPNGGPAAGGTLVTVTGANFSTASGATDVFFGSQESLLVTCASSTQCTAISGSSLGFPALHIFVAVNGLVSAGTDADVFTYGLGVTRVTPDGGPRAGNTDVLIEGEGFSTTPGATSFRFGTNLASNLSCGSTTSCTARTPPGSGTVSVGVTVDGSAQPRRAVPPLRRPRLRARRCCSPKWTAYAACKTTTRRSPGGSRLAA